MKIINLDAKYYKIIKIIQKNKINNKRIKNYNKLFKWLIKERVYLKLIIIIKFKIMLFLIIKIKIIKINKILKIIKYNMIIIIIVKKILIQNVNI